MPGVSLLVKNRYQEIRRRIKVTDKSQYFLSTDLCELENYDDLYVCICICIFYVIFRWLLLLFISLYQVVTYFSIVKDFNTHIVLVKFHF